MGASPVCPYFFLIGGEIMTETEFKKKLVDELQQKYPEAIILKNDPNSIQGIPDITIFNGNKWATLETKKSEKEPHRPNQDYYVDKMNKMSFSAFIFPENKEEVLNDLERSFQTSSRRCSRISRS